MFLLQDITVKLGKFCGLGAGTKIYTSSEDYTGEGICNLNLQKNKLNFKNFKSLMKKSFIGSHINIGANSVILPGTKIENNSSVAAIQ